MMKKKWMKPVLFVALILVGLTAYIVNGAEDVTEETTAHEFAAAERRSLEVTAEAAGQIEPIRLVEVKSKASGEITRLHVESGDAVRRGELLGEVDPRDVRNAYAQAEADLEVAKARQTTAQAQKRRSEELRKANVITEQEFEAATFEEANARSQLVKAQVNLELARERMGDVTIRAPIDGVIIQKSVEEGQIIQSASQNISGGTTILLMADLTVMQVRTLVDETDLGKIKPGQSARVTVEAFPGRTFQGTVMKIEPQAVIEQNVTMFPVLVRLDNQDGALRPGMNAEVVVEVARRENTVTVPNAAVVAMRDAAAAGALFGISEEDMRAAMRAGRGGNGGPAGDAAGAQPNGAQANGAQANGAQANGAQANGAQANGAQQNAAPANGTPQNAATGAQPNAATGGQPNAQPGAPTAGRADGQRAGQRPAGGDQRAAGERRRAGGDGAGATGSPQGAAPAGAGQRAGGAEFGGARAGGQGGRGNRGIGGGDTRMGVLFVRTATGVEPRVVVLGLNDWDHTEVLRGVEAGEEVVLISVARLQQQQQDMLNRMRQNTGVFPGAPAPGGPGGRR